MKRKDTQLIVENWRRFINEDASTGLKLYTVQSTRDPKGIEEKFKGGVQESHYTRGTGSIMPGFWCWRKASDALSHVDVEPRPDKRILELSCNDSSKLIPDLETLIQDYGGVKGEKIIYEMVKQIVMSAGKSSLIGSQITYNLGFGHYPEIVSSTIKNIKNIHCEEGRLKKTMQFRCDNDIINFFDTTVYRRKMMSSYTWSEKNPKPRSTPAFEAPPNPIYAFAYGLIDYAIKNGIYNNNLSSDFNKYRAYCYVGDPSGIEITGILSIQEFKTKHNL